MIAFRHGAGAAVGAAAADIAAATATPTATSTVTPGNVSSQSTPVTQIHHDSDVPPRYRRLPMSEEEIAYITVCLHSVDT